MKQKERAQLVQEILDQTIPDPKIPLHFSDPFTLLVATLLSAQCTDDKVNLITKTLFRYARTPEELCLIPYDTLEGIIRPCGLSKKKAKALLEIADILIEKYGGKVPSTFKDLETLPLVGHKTASVIRIHAFNKQAFPVDTHIFRSAHRWKLSQGKTVEEVEKTLKRLFPATSWARLHLQIILFARKYCKARPHDPTQCPMCRALEKAPHRAS